MQPRIAGELSPFLTLHNPYPFVRFVYDNL